MKTERIEISIKDAEFLREWLPFDIVVERLNSALSASHKWPREGQRLRVDFSTNELEMISNALADLLSREGITNGEINIRGRYIDSLIDVFSSHLYQ